MDAHWIECGMCVRSKLLRSSPAGEKITAPWQWMMACVQVELRVGVGQRYRSISDALADAPDGALVLLEPGTYSESLTISRSVRLAAAAEVSKTARRAGVSDSRH